MVITYYSREKDQPGKVANSFRGQLNRENEYFPVSSPFAPGKIWSRETSSAAPSRASLLILHTQAESSGAYSRDSSRFPWQAASIYLLIPPYAIIGSVPSFRVTQLLTDGVHCHESAQGRSSSPQVSVVPVTGAAAVAGLTMDQLMCDSRFPYPLLVYSGHVV